MLWDALHNRNKSIGDQRSSFDFIYSLASVAGFFAMDVHISWVCLALSNLCPIRTVCGIGIDTLLSSFGICDAFGRRKDSRPSCHQKHRQDDENRPRRRIYVLRHFECRSIRSTLESTLEISFKYLFLLSLICLGWQWCLDIRTKLGFGFMARCDIQCFSSTRNFLVTTEKTVVTWKHSFRWPIHVWKNGFI